LRPSNPLRYIEHEMAGLAVIWNGLIGSLALSIAMYFVPFLMMQIIDNFFKLGSNSQVQVWMQAYYYTFLIVFVVLISAIGDSLFKTAVSVMKKPHTLMGMLAETVPNFATFYLNYLLVQMGVDAFALVRFSQLGKFIMFKGTGYSQEDAQAAAEPEDQVSQGMGARSARMCLLITIPIIFVSLNPLVALVGLTNCVFCKVVYGYLFVYAETSKPDLGGEYWCAALVQLQYVVVLYVVLMAGKIYEATGRIHLLAIAFASLFYWMYAMRRFSRAFRWETLEFTDLKDIQDSAEDVEQEVFTPPRLSLGGVQASDSRRARSYVHMTAPQYAYRQKILDPPSDQISWRYDGPVYK